MPITHGVKAWIGNRSQESSNNLNNSRNLERAWELQEVPQCRDQRQIIPKLSRGRLARQVTWTAHDWGPCQAMRNSMVEVPHSQQRVFVSCHRAVGEWCQMMSNATGICWQNFNGCAEQDCGLHLCSRVQWTDALWWLRHVYSTVLAQDSFHFPRLSRVWFPISQCRAVYVV